MNEPKEYQKLFDFISNWVILSQNDIALITSKISLEKYAKGDIILDQGKVCTSLKFVISGIYRVYQLEDGKEITNYFNYKHRNPFVGSFVSLLKKEISNETISCIKSGTLISIPYTDWNSFYSLSQSLNTFGRLMAEFNYVLALERIASLQNQSASERYEAFIKLYPDLLNLIPHHYIASYLGVTPESLSRIRKLASKK